MWSDAAIEEADALHTPADLLCERLMATPALTQAGRAAKVRVLLLGSMHSECNNWRGPDELLDWDISLTRAVLAEFAGMSEGEISNV